MSFSTDPEETGALQLGLSLACQFRRFASRQCTTSTLRLGQEHYPTQNSKGSRDSHLQAGLMVKGLLAKRSSTRQTTEGGHKGRDGAWKALGGAQSEKLPSGASLKHSSAVSVVDHLLVILLLDVAGMFVCFSLQLGLSDVSCTVFLGRCRSSRRCRFS